MIIKTTIIVTIIISFSGIILLLPIADTSKSCSVNTNNLLQDSPAVWYIWISLLFGHTAICVLQKWYQYNIYNVYDIIIYLSPFQAWQLIPSVFNWVTLDI